MSRKQLTLLLALSLLAAETRPALAQSQAPAPAQPATAAQKPAASAQAPLDKHAEKIRRSVQRIGMSQTISVIIDQGDDLHGTIINIGEESFEITEVDQRRPVTVRYADVQKVRSGYAPHRDLFTGQRNSPPKGTKIAALAALIFVGVLLPVILVASAKD